MDFLGRIVQISPRAEKLQQQLQVGIHMFETKCCILAIHSFSSPGTRRATSYVRGKSIPRDSAGASKQLAVRNAREPGILTSEPEDPDCSNCARHGEEAQHPVDDPERKVS